jgi:hypothetical protein
MRFASLSGVSRRSQSVASGLSSILSAAPHCQTKKPFRELRCFHWAALAGVIPSATSRISSLSGISTFLPMRMVITF